VGADRLRVDRKAGKMIDFEFLGGGVTSCDPSREEIVQACVDALRSYPQWSLAPRIRRGAWCEALGGQFAGSSLCRAILALKDRKWLDAAASNVEEEGLLIVVGRVAALCRHTTVPSQMWGRPHELREFCDAKLAVCEGDSAASTTPQNPPQQRSRGGFWARFWGVFDAARRRPQQ